MGHAEIFAKLLQLFKFLRTNLLVDNDEWMAHLGRVIWPQLTESITRNYLSKVFIAAFTSRLGTLCVLYLIPSILYEDELLDFCLAIFHLADRFHIAG